MSQLDLFSYHLPAEPEPETKPDYKLSPDSQAAARERYENGLLVNRLFHAAIDNLEFAQDFIRQAQEIAIVDLEQPDRRITIALQEIWAAYYQENQLE